MAVFRMRVIVTLALIALLVGSTFAHKQKGKGKESLKEAKKILRLLEKNKKGEFAISLTTEARINSSKSKTGQSATAPVTHCDDEEPSKANKTEEAVPKDGSEVSVLGESERRDRPQSGRNDLLVDPQSLNGTPFYESDEIEPSAEAPGIYDLGLDQFDDGDLDIERPFQSPPQQSSQAANSVATSSTSFFQTRSGNGIVQSGGSAGFETATSSDFDQVSFSCGSFCSEGNCTPSGCTECRNGFIPFTPIQGSIAVCRTCRSVTGDINCAECGYVDVADIRCTQCQSSYGLNPETRRCERGQVGGNSSGSLSVQTTQRVSSTTSTSHSQQISSTDATRSICGSNQFVSPDTHECTDCDVYASGSCQDYVGCVKCLPGFFRRRLGPNSAFYCYPCTMLRCQECQDDIDLYSPPKCIVCEEGYQVDASSGLCVQSPSRN